MTFTSESDLESLIKSFENASISREAWKHAEHVAVAVCYARRFGSDDALNRMRSGLFNLLENGFGVDLAKEMPYHETLTVFWIRTVAVFAQEHEHLDLVALVNEAVAFFDKDYPLRFYTRELLFSDEARSRFVEGDLIVTQQTDIAVS